MDVAALMLHRKWWAVGCSTWVLYD